MESLSGSLPCHPGDPEDVLWFGSVPPAPITDRLLASFSTQISDRVVDAPAGVGVGEKGC